MEGTGLSATAMLTPTDGARPGAATITMAREEIEEALASNEPLEDVLTVDRRSRQHAGRAGRLAAHRSRDGLAGTDADGIMFSFDRAELYRSLEHPDFEGHGIREIVLLTVAAASASAALAASTASGQVLDGGGGGTSVTAVQPGDPGTIPYLSQGVGVDQSQFQGEPSTTGTQAEPATTIPYRVRGRCRPKPVPGRAFDHRHAGRARNNDPVPESGGRCRPKPVPGRAFHHRHAGRARNNDPVPESGGRCRPKPVPGRAFSHRHAGRARNNDPVPESGGRCRPKPVPGRAFDHRHAGRARNNDPVPESGGRCRPKPVPGRAFHRVRAGRRRLRLEPRAAVPRLGHGRRDRRPCRREPAHRRRRLCSAGARRPSRSIVRGGPLSRRPSAYTTLHRVAWPDGAADSGDGWRSRTTSRQAGVVSARSPRRATPFIASQSGTWLLAATSTVGRGLTGRGLGPSDASHPVGRTPAAPTQRGCIGPVDDLLRG